MFLSKKQQVLTADELIPLFTLILIKSDLKYLRSTFMLCDDYQMQETRQSELGYYFGTFEVSLEFIRKEAKKRNIDENTPTPEIFLERMNSFTNNRKFETNSPIKSNFETLIGEKHQSQKINLSKSITLKKSKERDIGGLLSLLDETNSDSD